VLVESLPRGEYVAQVEASYLARVEDQAILSLWLVCKNRKRMCETIIDFLIHQPDQELQQRERDRLQSVAAAVGLELFEDSEQLHGIPFKLTVWRDNPMRFSCRPASDAEKEALPRSLRGPSKDGGGPHAA
jgi:hypothetical protein